MSQSNVGMGYDCMDAGGRSMQERLPSDNVTQQIQEDSPNYGDSAEMSGYAALTRPSTDAHPTYEPLPKSWIMVSLSEIAALEGGNAFKSKEYDKEGLPILRMGNVTKDFKINWDKKGQPFISINRLNEFEKYQLHGGELVICLTDMSTNAEYLGTVAINNKEALLNQRVSKFIFNEHLFDKKYLFYYLRSPLVRRYLVVSHFETQG